MLSSTKKILYTLVSSALAGSCLLLSPASSVRAADLSDVQLVCDQETAGAGEVASYHIIYHNVTNKAQANVGLKVILPVGLDPDLDNLQDAVWEESRRTLKWNLQEIETNGAIVIHFNLKVKSTLAVGDLEEIYCVVEGEDGFSVETPKVKIRVGTQLDQPFFQGYPDEKFHPASFITRAEVAAVVTRIQNLNNAATLKTPYKDVASSHWANGYINNVTNAGYMHGYEDGSFHPDEPISRAELVAIVLRLRGVHEVPLNSFPDVKGNWAQDIIGTATALNFVEGMEDGNFHPNGHTERQAAAKLFDVGLFRGPLVDGAAKVVQHFPDVSANSWSFGWVEEASTVAHESLHKGNGREYLIRYLPDQTEPF